MSEVVRRRTQRERRGSALVLVLVMTLSLAGLAVSAVLLTSSSALVQRYYDKEKDYRFAAVAAVGIVKATVQRDTTITIPPHDSAYRALTASALTDASGSTIATIKVNAYAAYTGDTAGTYIPFLTLMAQAYDTLGTRSVVRRDLWSEAFSRYAMFVDSFPSTESIAVGQHIRGRVHGNRNWNSTSTSPGPYYYDTVTAVGAVNGTANYNSITAVTGAKRVRWPTTSTLSNLSTYGSAGNLSFAPVAANGTAAYQFGVDLSGRLAAANPRTGTRVSFRPVDVNNNGTIDAAEGFFMVFDLATGIDTGSLRADLKRTAPGVVTSIVMLNQCGLMATIGGRKEFFPVTRFRELWVRARVRNATAPTISDADTATMGANTGGGNAIPTSAAVNKIMSYGNGYSRCFPAGSPYLMLAERHVESVSGVCTITTSTGDRPYGWGATTGACGVAQQYGGQDTTFTWRSMRCLITGIAGRCDANQDRLGTWQTFPGTSTASPPASVIQSVQIPYLWPISSTYNSTSRGVAYASNSNPVFASDTLRGFLTFFSAGRVVLVDDLVYDADPTSSGNECRNFLGIIAASGLTVADNALNRPRPDPGSTWRFFGTPHYTIHGILMALSGSVGVESASGTESASISCNGTTTSGGCLNHTGGVITKVFAASNAGAGSGFIDNRTRDVCQEQQLNRRPPFFPLTGKYADYKEYDVDPRNASTWTLIKTYVARLRGANRKVP